MNPPRNAGLDMTKVQTVDGTVTAVNVAVGAQYPSIQIGQETIKVAPVWFLLENDFEIKTGDKLSVVAAPSARTADPYLSAIKITNAVSASVMLRDQNGLPLWTAAGGRWQENGNGRGDGNGRGPDEGNGACTACGVSSIATVSGVVDQVTAGLGIQFPTLVLKTADKMLTLKIGPERLLEAADFEIKAGDTLTAKYAVVVCTGETVALELTNAAGVKVVLRNDDGAPAWR
jgi:hypothetical protein